MPDPGADTAFVVALKANIREEPNKTSTILIEVKRGEALSLIEREPTGTWYRVIHVESAIDGWIDQSVIVNKLTSNRYTAPKFQEEESDVYGNPEVKITNREKYTNLNLRMNGVLYVINADTTRTFSCHRVLMSITVGHPAFGPHLVKVISRKEPFTPGRSLLGGDS